jgi:hypothetical protein
MPLFWNKKHHVKVKIVKVASATELRSAPGAAPVWTVEDVLNLNKFFQTSTGTKLLQRARAMEYNTAVRSCRDAFHTVHSAGVAAGVSDTIHWLESLAGDEMRQKLSEPTPVEVGNPQPTAQSEHDDAGLVEKYSP